jgi:uncharacterized protein YbjT (DUF2867 family)
MTMIGVCGITGTQGGAVAKKFLENDHKVVGITRNLNSNKSINLIKQGVILKNADYDNKTSLKGVFRDCEVVFVVTNFWEHMDSEREFKQAKNIIDSAVSEESVKHIIWSTLEDTRMFKDEIEFIGKYKVPHFDEKGMVSKYLNTLNVKSTNLYTSFFYENLTGLMKLRKDEDGKRRLCLPMNDSKLPIVAVQDIGKMVFEVFKNKIYGDVGVSSEHLTCEEIAKTLNEVIGEPVEYVSVSANIYRNFGFPGCRDLGNMFEFKDLHNEEFCKVRNMESVLELIKPISFKEWCLNNKDLL